MATYPTFTPARVDLSQLGDLYSDYKNARDQNKPLPWNDPANPASWQTTVTPADQPQPPPQLPPQAQAPMDYRGMGQALRQLPQGFSYASPMALTRWPGGGATGSW